MTPLAAFLAEAPEGLRALPDLEAPLDALWARARAAWPALPADASAFARYVAQRLAPASDLAVLSTLAIEDLYLAWRCGLGDAAALRAFERALIPPLRRELARLFPEPEVDETLQQLRQKLFMAGVGNRPRIADYAGRAPLSTWLRTAALRAGLSRARRRAPPIPHSDAALQAAAGAGPDLELQIIQRRHRDDFRAALRASLDALPARDQELLRLHYLEGLSIDRLCVRYRVHRSTAARWVAGAREALLIATRARLTTRLRLSPAELDSLLRVVQGTLGASLQSLLRRP